MAEQDSLPEDVDSERTESEHLSKDGAVVHNKTKFATTNHVECNVHRQVHKFSGERSVSNDASAAIGSKEDRPCETITLPNESLTRDSLSSSKWSYEQDDEEMTRKIPDSATARSKQQLPCYTATNNGSTLKEIIYKKLPVDGKRERNDDGAGRLDLADVQEETSYKSRPESNNLYGNIETANEGFTSFENCIKAKNKLNDGGLVMSLDLDLEQGEIEESDQSETVSELRCIEDEKHKKHSKCSLTNCPNQTASFNHDLRSSGLKNNVEVNFVNNGSISDGYAQDSSKFNRSYNKRKNVSVSEVDDAKRAKKTNHRREVDNNFEYDIIDDLDLSSDMDYNECFPDVTSESDYNDVPEEEIDAMLDEGLDAYRRKKNEKDDESQSAVEDDDLTHEEREKVVLKVRGHDHFEILPEGWIEVTHNSGMPVYLHKVTRVCTLSKPYFLGPGSARKHEIPLTAIPCLHYRREIEKEKSGTEEEETPPAESSPSEGTNSTSGSKAQLPSAKIESVLDNNKEKSLDHLQVRKYCEKLFEFQTITVRRFKTWAGRRKHQKLVKQLQRPTLPSGTKLITCPLPPPTDKDETAPVKPRREFTMNPNGKSHVCILHEYVQHAMRVQPKYIFKELENAKKPYGATVIINDMEYGTGYGSSKKQAKSEAAKTTLEILIPQIRQVNSEEGTSIAEQQDLAFFDEVHIKDPRISELCAKAGQPSPYQILLECLKRNYGMGDTEVKLEMKTLKHQKNEFTMTVGKHRETVVCKNKRDGKQRASQAILQALHSHIRSWGSLLRLYGKGSCKTLKEKKLEEQQITELQSRASANRPNLSILNKLKEEMLKLKEKREAVKPIGKFMPGDVELPLDSGCNLQNLDL